MGNLWFFEGDDKPKKDLAIAKVFSLARTKGEISEAMLNTGCRLIKLANDIVRFITYL